MGRQRGHWYCPGRELIVAKQTVLSEVLSVIGEAGGAELDRVGRNKHAKVRWCYRDQPLTTICSLTASDHRAKRNAVAFVRRQMREVDSA